MRNFLRENKRTVTIVSLILTFVFLSSVIFLNLIEINNLRNQNALSESRLSTLNEALEAEANLNPDAELEVRECSSEFIQAKFEEVKESPNTISLVDSSTDTGGCKFDLNEYVQTRVDETNPNYEIMSSTYYRGDTIIVHYYTEKDETVTGRALEVAEYSVSQNKFTVIRRYDAKLQITDLKIINSPDFTFREGTDGLLYQVELLPLNCIEDKECTINDSDLRSVCTLNQVGTWYYEFGAKKLTRISTKSSACK